MNNLLIYQDNVRKSYLYLIKENLNLIRKLLKEREKYQEPFNPQREFMLYRARSKHFQIMNLVGQTAEHLVKIILLKRGFVLNQKVTKMKFSEDFMKKIYDFNKGHKTPEKMNDLYSEAEKDINFSFSNKLIKFDKCIQLFNQDNNKTYPDYFEDVGKYNLNPDPQIYNGYEYFGYKEIIPKQCLSIIQKSRNSYTHLLEAHYEQNGIVWYFINFLIWLAKEEFPNFFKDEEYIGNDRIKCLFKRKNDKSKNKDK